MYARSKHSRFFGRIRFVLIVFIGLLALALLLGPAGATTTSPSAMDAVQAAWNKARQSDSYHFNATVVQTTIPKPLITNVGVSSREQRLYLEGEAAQDPRVLAMKVWSDESSLDPTTGSLDVRVEGERVMVRQGDGPWEEIDNFSSSFAPQGDLLSFLTAADGVEMAGTETALLPAPAGQEISLPYTRYTFRIDGPRMAAYVRDQLQQYYAEQGGLPAGVQFDLPQAYAEMTGEGELWVGTDGLPLRQILYLHYPEQKDSRAEVEVTIDFDFPPAAGATGRPSGLLGWLGDIQWPSVSQVAAIATWLVLTGTLLSWLAWQSLRRNKIYAPLAVLILLCMLLTPLLQDFRVGTFLGEQDRRAEAAERRQESEMSSAMLGLQSPPASPHSSQLQVALAESGVMNCLDGDTSDLDGDGLNACEEAVLGTNSEGADTDGDGLDDGIEVAGFQYNSQFWYPDPLESDTNQDGRGDYSEWDPAGSPAEWDLDGDGTPNLFDLDDDGDGVPDQIDLSPESHTAGSFTPDDPFGLIVEGLTPGTPTYVEFQIRPANPAHLGYAMNVVDWPLDKVAQMQDADGATWADENPDLPLVPNSFGDIRLVPALEIRISGSQGNLPNAADLQRYGLSVIDRKPDGSERIVNVPLMIDTDPAGRGRVALSGKMLYRPGASWGNVQQVRLLWMVQALNDDCESFANGLCSEYGSYNNVAVLHSYYDEWTLTGLRVSEDHGVDFALLYDDPAVDPEPDQDGVLFSLANGLDNSFLAGRDQDDDGLRDLSVEELYRRFDHATNGGVSAEERWGLPNTLSVRLASYEYFDEALATIAMTDTKVLLADAFGSPPAAPITPTIMFAYQQRFRATGLDEDNTLIWSGNRLTVQMAPGGDSLSLYTQVGVRWAPFFYDTDAGTWNDYPIDDYWSELARRYTFDLGDPDETEGVMQAARLYYMGLYRSPSMIVQQDDTVLESTGSSDAELRADYEAWVEPAQYDTAGLVHMVYDRVTGPNFVGDLGETIGAGADAFDQLSGCQELLARYPELRWSAMSGTGRTLVCAAVVLVIAAMAIAMALPYLGLDENTTAVVGIVVQRVTGVFSGIVFVLNNLVRGSTKISSSVGSVAKNVGKVLSVVAFLVSVGAIWFSFLKSCADLTGVAFDQALAMAIAATLFALISFLLDLLTGGIFSTVLAILDAILELFGLTALSEWFTSLIAGQLFGFDVMVAMAPKMSSPELTYGDLPAGLSGEIELSVGMDITTTISHTAPQDWRVREVGLKYYTAQNLRTTRINYALNSGTVYTPTLTPVSWHMISCSPGTGRGEGCSAWNRVQRQLPQPVTLTPGLNRPVPLSLVTAYRLPAVKCWSIPLFGWFWHAAIFCDLSSVEDDSSSNMGFQLDVFPATLDEFFAMAWDPALQPPRDLDGDGLVSAAYGGVDPNDALWDTDGDGLADAYELTLRQEGTNVSATSADTDGDGLDDAAELRYGSDPGRPDTDGDGLTDRQEVDGWALNITSPGGTLAVHVTSDPTEYDTDGDGLSDLAEKTLHEASPSEYATNPRVANPSPLAIYTGTDDEDAIVAAGATFVYTATVANNLIAETGLLAVGDLDVTMLSPYLQPSGGLDTPFSLFPGQAITSTSPVLVQPAAPSGPAAISNTASAFLTSNPNCNRLRFDLLYCAAEADDEGDATSEVYLRVGEQQIWSRSGIDGGGSYPIDAGSEACGQAVVELWEDDTVGEDDLLATWMVDMTALGSYAQQIDYGTEFQGRVDYRVERLSLGTIAVGDAFPLLVDADPPSVALISLQPGQYIAHVPGQDILVVGGVAADPTSGIAGVEVSIDGGPWTAAQGAESWAYDWTLPIQPGWHTIRTRTADVVGHVYTDTAGVSVIVDIDSPAIDTPIIGGTILAATQDEQGRWRVPLYGTVSDGVGGGLADPPGSGVAGLEVLLIGEDNVAGQGWQTATLTPNGSGFDWTIDYLLPERNNEGKAQPNPTGSYMFLFRAQDNAGLLTPEGIYPGVAIRVDDTAPQAVVTDAGPWPVLINEPLTLSGVITDVGIVARGLDGLQISYTPGEVAGDLGETLLDLLLLLHLDEPTGTTLWDDAAGNGPAGCDGANCPTAGVAGPSGRAVAFDGVDDRLLVSAAPNLDSQSLSVAFWAQRQGAGAQGVVFMGDPAQGLAINFLDGYLTCEFGGSALASPVAADNGWHYWSCTYNAATRTRTIYYDGAPVANDTPPAGYQGYGPLYVGLNPSGGTPFYGQIDEVTLWKRALTANEMQTLYQTPGLIWHWQPATLAASGPGITQTTWSHVVPGSNDGHDPEGLEGIYRLDLRGQDVLGNRSTRRADWPQWQGEIDTLAPRVAADYAPAGSGPVARTAYTCTVEDMNLGEATWQCPCLTRPEDRIYYDSSWWQDWFTATERLYRIESSCIVPGYHPEPPTVGACDLFGHCTSWTPPRREFPEDPVFDSVVLTPTYGAVLTTPTPHEVAGMAFAAHQLKTLTVTVDGAVIYTENWPAGISGDSWSTTWTPPGEGVYTLLSVLEDQFGAMQPDLHPITVTVDLLPPEILIAPTVFTSAHSLGPGWILLTGRYTETGAVDKVSVEAPFSVSAQLRGYLQQQGLPAPTSARAEGGASYGDGAWQYGWYLGRDPDAETFNVTAVITDVGGRRVQRTQAVLVDSTPPGPFTVTLSYTNSSGQLVPLEPGQAVRDKIAPVRLMIDWTPSGDGGGLAYYWAGWTTSPEPDLDYLTRYGPSILHHEQDVGDLLILYAHVAAEDDYGNRRWYTLGPIYVDYRTTPDLFPLALNGPVYHGWMDEYSQVGADRAVRHNAMYGQAITGTQRLYASWDDDILRLAWVGADWNNDGDLFVYLDTVPGGSTVAYNPYPETPDTVIDLPAQGGSQLAADYMVWVQDEETAGLWQWNGSAWILAHSLAGYYRLDTLSDPAYTDLALPRNWLGLNPGVSLKLVALASEEDGLLLWAAMPERNPLNSELANSPSPPPDAPHFSLTQQYEWANLPAGAVPNLGQFADSDLRVSVSSTPAGLPASFPATDLYVMAPGMFVDADLDGLPDMDLNREPAPNVVGHGKIISYTLVYTNAGPAAAPDVVITATARGALDLNGGNPFVAALGDVPPGESGTVTFWGTVNTTVYTRALEVDWVVADGPHGPYEWFWTQHGVDREPPEDLEIVAPLEYVRPFTNTVRGTVRDASPVPSLILDGLGPGGPLTMTLCLDETPEDGNWVCSWNVGPANDGDQFLLRVQAADLYGNVSAWTAWVTLTVDAYPPTITLSAESETALQGAELGAGDSLLLTGAVEDDLEADGAEFCTGSGAGRSCADLRVIPGGEITGTWRYMLQAPGGLDHETLALTMFGRDGAGNYSAPLSRTCLIDTVPPAVVVTYYRSGVPLGAPRQVLAGTVSDGSGRIDLYLVLTSPDGTVTSGYLGHSGGNWSYTLVAGLPGRYTLHIEARDPAGNVKAYGPFPVVSAGPIYLPFIIK